MLMSAGLNLPKMVFGHGFLTKVLNHKKKKKLCIEFLFLPTSFSLFTCYVRDIGFVFSDIIASVVCQIIGWNEDGEIVGEHSRTF